jgi:hypothetical protein
MLSPSQLMRSSILTTLSPNDQANGAVTVVETATTVVTEVETSLNLVAAGVAGSVIWPLSLLTPPRRPRLLRQSTQTSLDPEAGVDLVPVAADVVATATATATDGSGM